MSKFMTLKAIAFLTLLPMLAHADSNRHSMTVYKSLYCGCCKVWAEAMKKEGYQVTIKNTDNLTPIKRQAGVGEEMEACHTAVLKVGDRSYVVEGHVPLQALRKLIAEKPDIQGIAVPGMPMGSLGMGYNPKARYTVYSFSGTGSDQPKPFYEAGE